MIQDKVEDLWVKIGERLENNLSLTYWLVRVFLILYILEVLVLWTTFFYLTPYEIVWVVVCPSIIVSWYHLLKNQRAFVSHEAIPPLPWPKIIFLYAAREYSETLQKGIDSVLSSCKYIEYSNYEIKVVLKNYSETTIDGAEVFVPPDTFICSSMYKSRQLQYMLGFLPNTRDIWIFHLDEDAQICPQTVVSLINYIQKDKPPIAQGPSIFPPNGKLFSRHLIPFLTESHRQWTFFWLRDQVRSFPLWLNGSNLFVRSDIEQSIQWNSKAYLGEDSRFALIAGKRFGKIFGWHGGLTIEQPPSNIRQVLVQRKRWFCSGMLNLFYTPITLIPRRLYAIACWTSSLFLTIGFFLSFSGLFSNMEHLQSIIIVTRVLWVGRYIIGVYWNLKYTKTTFPNRLAYFLFMGLLTPVVDLIVSLPTVICLISPPKTFEATVKI